MNRIYKLRSLTSALALLSSVAGNAWAIDITGTWQGKQTCQNFDGGKYTGAGPDTLFITQTGADFYMDSAVVGARYHGRIIEDSKNPNKKAQATFVDCETTESSDFQEMGRATKLNFKPNGVDLDFQATSILRAPRWHAATSDGNL